MTKEVFWDTVKEYIDRKVSDLPIEIQTLLDTYNWDGILKVTTAPLEDAILNAQSNVDLVLNTLLECEAKKRTAKSYSDEPVNTKVKEYSVVNGVITHTDTNDFSALHYAKVAESISSGFIFQGSWDPASGYPTKGAQNDPLTAKMSWTVSVAGTNPDDSTTWKEGDTLVRNITNDGWDKISSSVDWSNISGVPANVQGAITNAELQAGLSTKANTTDMNTALDKKVSSQQESGVGDLISNEIVLTQAEYNGITKNPTTLYVIVG